MQFFEVTKILRFGRVLRRVILLNREEDGSGGTFQVMTKEGQVRRDVEIHNIISVDKVEGDCRVVLRFLVPVGSEGSQGEIGEVSHVYIFDTERMRDLFIGVLSTMNPRLRFVSQTPLTPQVAIGSDGRPVSSRPRARTSDKPAARGTAKSTGAASGRVKGADDGGDDDGGDGGAGGGASPLGDLHVRPSVPEPTVDRSVTARVFGVTGGGVVRQPLGRKFFVMQYNAFGFREPRVAALTQLGGLLQLYDGMETLRSEFSLHQLRDVLVHAVDDTVVSLSFAIGACWAVVEAGPCLMRGLFSIFHGFSCRRPLTTCAASLSSCALCRWLS